MNDSYFRKVEKKKSSGKCTKITCETDDGNSMEFEICIKNGNVTNCKKVGRK